MERASGSDLNRYRVPKSELKAKNVVLSPLREVFATEVADGDNMESWESEEKLCDRSFLLMKIDAVLMFFNLQSQKPKIGFTPPPTS